MSLNRFGQHTSIMTIDKFGKHIHGHSLSAHLKRPEIVQRHLTQKTILTLTGDGSTNPNGDTFIIQNLGYVTKYTNFFYIGEIASYRIVGDVKLLINGANFDPNKALNVLSFGSTLICQPTNKTRPFQKPFIIELVIEKVRNE